MIRWKLLIPWLMRSWPILALVPVAIFHFIAHQVYPADPVFANKLVSASLQFAGGILVLWSVNDNLGLFRSQSLKSAFIGWFKDHPRVREPISAYSSTCDGADVTSASVGTVAQIPNTLEERVAEIESKLAEVRTQLTQELQAINVKIEEAKSESSKQISETSTGIANLAERLEHTAVGNFKLLSLGVALAFWGSVTSVFA